MKETLYQVQQKHGLKWEMWFTHYSKEICDKECSRRIEEATGFEKKSWRVIPISR